MTQVKLLNSELSNNSTLTVNFLFGLIVLPISDSGLLVDESSASGKHFATLVYVKESDSFMVFEFDQKLLDGLLAYRARYGDSMLGFEILLSRNDVGMLIMTIGANKLGDTSSLQKKADSQKSVFDSLYSLYKNKKNYTVFEMNSI